MFFKKYDVTPATQDWNHESFEWAITHGILRLDTPLVLPTRDFFKAPSGTDPETVRLLLQDIKTLLHIPDEPIDILPLDILPDEYRHEYGKLSDVAGTWQQEQNSAVIRYNPNHTKNKIPFIATLTHELMHHVLHSIPELPPGGAEAEELSTDFHCITAGFGLFQLAGAELTGWQGYMRQSTRAHALAVFLAVRDIPVEQADDVLPPRAKKLLRRAVKEVAKSPQDIADLKQLLHA